jgi:hypothetical protein
MVGNWKKFNAQVDRGSEEPDSESGSGGERRASEPGGGGGVKAGSESPKGAARGGRPDSEEHDGAGANKATTNGINGVGG